VKSATSSLAFRSSLQPSGLRPLPALDACRASLQLRSDNAPGRGEGFGYGKGRRHRHRTAGWLRQSVSALLAQLELRTFVRGSRPRFSSEAWQPSLTFLVFIQLWRKFNEFHRLYRGPGCNHRRDSRLPRPSLDWPAGLAGLVEARAGCASSNAVDNSRVNEPKPLMIWKVTPRSSSGNDRLR
jgi:hypothetical protein